jgi:hypothetical protein
VLTVIAGVAIIWARDDAHTARNEATAARAEAAKAQADLETEKKASAQMLEELTRLRKAAERKGPTPVSDLQLREATGPEVLYTMRKPGGIASTFAKTFEALNGEFFAWVYVMDDNYHKSFREGLLAEHLEEKVDKVTIVCSADTVLFSAPNQIFLPLEPKSYGGVRMIASKFFDKPISPSYGQPFTIFQLVTVEAKGSVGDSDAVAVIAKDPFAPIKPLAPMGDSGKHITRISVVCMKVDNKWWKSDPGRVRLSTRPEQVSAFAKGVLRPWVDNRTDR